MAQIPGDLLMQQNDGIVTVFHRYTQEEYHRFDPADPHVVCNALYEIWADARLDEEQRCFVSFWAGYFYAHATTTKEW